MPNDRFKSVLFIGGPHSGRAEMMPSHCNKATVPAKAKQAGYATDSCEFETHDYDIDDLAEARAIAWHRKTPRAELLLILAKDFESAQAKRDAFLERDRVAKTNDAMSMLRFEYQSYTKDFVDTATFEAAFKFGYNFAKRGFIDTARNVVSVLFAQKDWFS